MNPRLGQTVYFRKILIYAMRLVGLFILLLLGFLASAEDEPKKYTYFEGRIIDVNNNKIGYAHIINLNRRFGVVSDPSGRFVMPLMRGDSIMITHVSHLVRFVMIDVEHINHEGPYELIILPKVFELSEVVVRPLPGTRLEFKQAFVNIELPATTDSVKLRMPHINTMVYSGPQQGFGVVMKGPFQTFYDLFSKEAKQIRKLEKEIETQQLQEEIEKRYNHDLVYRLTHIADEAEREKFMQYCNIPVGFILNSTDYDLCIAIIRCFESYRLKMGRGGG